MASVANSGEQLSAQQRSLAEYRVPVDLVCQNDALFVANSQTAEWRNLMLSLPQWFFRMESRPVTEWDCRLAKRAVVAGRSCLPPTALVDRRARKFRVGESSEPGAASVSGRCCSRG